MAAIYNIQECLLTIQIGKEIIEEFKKGERSEHSIGLEYRNGDGTLFRKCTLWIYSFKGSPEDMIEKKRGDYFSVLTSHRFCLAETLYRTQLFFLRNSEFYTIPKNGIIEDRLGTGRVRIHIQVI